MTVPTEPTGPTQKQSAPEQPPFAPQNPAPVATKSWFARHKILTGIGGVIVLIIAVNVLGGGGDDGDVAATTGDATAVEESAVESEDAAADTADTADAEDAPKEEAPKEEPAETTPGIGDAVRDGKFEFTVTGVETGVASVGNEYLSQEAQGQYVLVSMSVENIGDESQYFFGDNQSLTDTEGRTHSADSSASIYLEESDSLATEINPGNSVDGIVAFDVPADAVPATIDLHDSAFSGGIVVTLK
ncbi:protein of unknown function [Paraoerskovia marina]|uniref:DUF4352 domain-containing protein n=1 Tax=Paraoerskovia marina TaxID=545619 RepID=A0A1H1P0K7_9CELL|nr:DUF4352 domain-containing protein [Paraoerskovia marina]SDS04565.1 protein of unknown function [Paraoerskovia marina]